MHFCLTHFIILGWFCGWLNLYFRYFGQNTKIAFTRSDGTAYSDRCARYRLTAGGAVVWILLLWRQRSTNSVFWATRTTLFPNRNGFSCRRFGAPLADGVASDGGELYCLLYTLRAFSQIQTHNEIHLRVWCCTEFHPCVRRKSTHGRMSWYMCVRNNMPGDHQRKPAYIGLRL